MDDYEYPSFGLVMTALVIGLSVVYVFLFEKVFH